MTEEQTAIIDAPPADGLPSAPPAEPDAPPKRGRGRPRKTTAPAGPAGTAPGAGDRKPRTNTPRRRASKSEVAKSATGVHQAIGLMVLPKAGLPSTGALVLANAADAGEIWGELAERYPLIARLFTGGGDGVLFLKLAMVYWPILQHAQSEKAGTLDNPAPAPALPPLLAAAMNGALPA